MAMLYHSFTSSLIITGGTDDLYFNRKFTALLQIKVLDQDHIATRVLTHRTAQNAAFH